MHEMSSDALAESEELLKQLDSLRKFNSKYNVYPYGEAAKLLENMRIVADSITENPEPESKEEVIFSELKRRLEGEATSLEQGLQPTHYDFDKVVSAYATPKLDIEALRPWLEENREKTLNAIKRIHDTNEIQKYELGLPVDIPGVRRQSEEFASVHIQRYHKRLGKMLEDLSEAAEFLREIDAAPTTQKRSYFNYITKTLALGIPAITFLSEDGTLQLRERELIKLYGHEGMGHALNKVITNSNNIPYFLTQESSLITGTQESMAQFYQNVIFEDLKKSPETQKDLGIKHKFEEIYQEAKDISQLEEYQSKLFQYAIKVMSDKSLGEPQNRQTVQKKVNLISEVTLDPSYPLSIVENNRQNFDSQGNLNSALVSELRYCAKPVDRVLKEFESKGITYEGEGRSLIDSTLLKGFWTPIGYEQNAKLVAEENKDKF